MILSAADQAVERALSASDATQQDADLPSTDVRVWYASNGNPSIRMVASTSPSFNMLSGSQNARSSQTSDRRISRGEVEAAESQRWTIAKGRGGLGWLGQRRR